MWPKQPENNEEAADYMLRAIAVFTGRIFVAGMLWTLLLVQMATVSQVAPEEMVEALTTAFQLFGHEFTVWHPFTIGIVGWVAAPLILNSKLTLNWWWGER